MHVLRARRRGCRGQHSAGAARPTPRTIFGEDACALFCQALYFGDGSRTLGWESWEAAARRARGSSSARGN